MSKAILKFSLLMKKLIIDLTKDCFLSTSFPLIRDIKSINKSSLSFIEFEKNTLYLLMGSIPLSSFNIF